MFRRIKESVVKRSVNEIKNNFELYIDTDLYINDEPYFIATVQASIYGKVFLYRKLRLAINEPIQLSGREVL